VPVAVSRPGERRTHRAWTCGQRWPGADAHGDDASGGGSWTARAQASTPWVRGVLRSVTASSCGPRPARPRSPVGAGERPTMPSLRRARRPRRPARL